MMKWSIKNNLRIIAAIFVGVILLTAGCDRRKFFDESLSLKNDKWPKDQAMSFKVSVEDTIALYRFFINVRHSTSYKYKNVYFFLTTEFPGGGFSRDTINCQLAAKNGEWFGKGTGRYRDNRIPIRSNIRFPRAGTYTLSLNQAMREDVLNGISEAGIRLEKQENRK